jgi:hypothetical protein
MKTTLFFDYASTPHTKNEDFWVTVMLDTLSQSINAIEGNIVVDPRFTIKDINDADSNIPFWIERPIQDKNTVSFSGIIPGGFVSNKGRVFSLLVRPNEIGNATISARDIKILQNDGKGSSIESTVVAASIQITEGQARSTTEIVDTELPESFTPLVSTNPALFDGKNFVVFSTQDKLSGIKEYQVKEGFWGTYTLAQSPYELQYQRVGVLLVAVGHRTEAIAILRRQRIHRALAANAPGLARLVDRIFVRVGHGLFKFCPKRGRGLATRLGT